MCFVFSIGFAGKAECIYFKKSILNGKRGRSGSDSGGRW